MQAVYALEDPRNNRPFYVGVTEDMFERFIQHLRCDGSNYRKDALIQELKEEYLLPIMRTLQLVPTQIEGKIQEAYWINHYLQLGISLCNNSIPTPLDFCSPKKQRMVRNQIRRAKEAASQEPDAKPQWTVFLQGVLDKEGQEECNPLVLFTQKQRTAILLAAQQPDMSLRKIRTAAKIGNDNKRWIALKIWLSMNGYSFTKTERREQDRIGA